MTEYIGPVETPKNEYEAEAMIILGIPGIHSHWYGQVPGFYLVQRNGKQGKFTSALEAINFYNSTFNVDK